MATASSNTTANAGTETNGNSNVPQWKRDLIQRRRQQTKVLANNGASVKLCSAVIGTSPVTANVTPTDGSMEQQHAAAMQEHSLLGDSNALRASRLMTTNEDTTTMANVLATCGAGSSSGSALLSSPSSYPARRVPPTSGAIVAGGTAAITVADFAQSVAYNMRLEAGLSLCSDAEDLVNGALTKFVSDTSERKSLSSEYVGDAAIENEETSKTPPDGNNKMRMNTRTNNESNLSTAQRDEIRAVTTGRGKDSHSVAAILDNKSSSQMSSTEDAESDSSEELQYGPGIVNKLKSKYLNLTLRETNKNRVSVQRFRRAASLEDLLDRDDDEATGHEKTSTARKYVKRSGPTYGSGGIIAPKNDRYRNASRGNDSMKRARSVETLMRYNGAPTDEVSSGLRIPTANGVHQEPINDHIVLVDRTSIKIESRLSDPNDRPKLINKPKRIKPVLAETERPPPDLVKTTMRIFEGSVRKLKPKGEVAAKVATFKTINDTFKAQTAQKKLIPKPPVQPKPFVNGGARGGASVVSSISSPKRILLSHKPMAELIETQDGQGEFHIDGVITEPIIQSVSSVVSKFQQIEKSHSPSPSPEPISYQKLRFSPANSPEPPLAMSLCKPKSSLEINVKSPPVTPVVLSPKISSPRLQSPSSPVKDQIKQGSQSPSSPIKDSTRFVTSSPFHKPPLPSSPVKDSSKTEQEPSKPLYPQKEKESSWTNIERLRQARLLESSTERKEDAKPSHVASNDMEQNVGNEEIVDGPRTISKVALDNISKAGTTMQFNFSDKPVADKSYLPVVKENGQKSMDKLIMKDNNYANIGKTESRDKSMPLSDIPASVNTIATFRLQDRLEPEKQDKINDKDVEEKPIIPESKPIGAICSLSLIKPTTTTITTSTTTSTMYSSNETKTIRCQKNEFSPPQQKQIGIIRPLVTTKTQHSQQNLSNRELEKNLINRVKSIEQPTKVVVSLKSADEIQPTKKVNAGSGGGGLWDTKPWNQQNNTMVFNFSNRKDVPDYIENDGLIIRRKREKPKLKRKRKRRQKDRKTQKQKKRRKQRETRKKRKYIHQQIRFN